MKWVILALIPCAAGADPMDGAAVAAFWGENTVTYESGGLLIGWEEYRADRRVVWKTAGGSCEYGRWSEGPAGQICFHYDGGSGPVCWRFDQTAGKVTARSVIDPAAPPLTATARTPQPLQCPGLEVGV